MSKNRVSIFSNGSQYMDWMDRNCCECAKEVCEYQRAISVAAIDDGTISNEIAKRMGYTDPLEYTWDCPEKEEV